MRMRRSIMLVMTMLAVLAFWAGVGEAQKVADPVREKQAQDIERLLRCPVCTGQSVAESHSEVAEKIKVEIRQFLREGKNQDQILDYYMKRYGDWILTSPPARGVGLVAWVLPGVAGVVALIVLVAFMRRVVGGQAAAPAVAAAAAGAGGGVAGGEGQDKEQSDVQQKVYDRLRDFI